ncbi:unnamed protein product [Urochloa humidicola]
MGSQDALPDAILELVFLGLNSPLYLHRAASTCKHWRRIIASDAFRAFHSTLPIVAGFYYNDTQPSSAHASSPRHPPPPSTPATSPSTSFPATTTLLAGGSRTAGGASCSLSATPEGEVRT